MNDNQNDSKLCEKVIMLKVQEKILSVNYPFVMFIFWEHSASI